MNLLLAALIVYVAPTGNDTNPGSFLKPFATLERARDARPDIVEISGGTYPVTQTFRLTGTDSNTTYRAAAGEHPIFTGGIRLREFQAVADSKLVTVKLNQKLPPLELGGFASGRGFKTHPVVELFFNAQALPLARWPKTGFTTFTGTNATGIIFDNDRLARWQQEPDLWLYGYWYYDWADSYEHVAGIDAGKHQITLATPLPHYGLRAGQKFFALNARCELDSPGEWYLDRQHNRLDLYPPASLRDADVELSALSVPFVDINGARNIRLEGLTWEFGCADGLIIVGGNNVTVTGCTIRHCAGNGIEIHGGSNCAVQACDIYSLGRGGIVLDGGDRATLRPGDHRVENCDIHDLSRIDHTYTPGVLVYGVGLTVRHCLFHHIASSALRVEGNDHWIEYNEIHHVVLESDDQGGVDMWGDPTFRGNVYRYNYFHDIGHGDVQCGQAGIRLDDAISGVLIQSNLLERCGGGNFGAVQIHGGKDNIVADNFFRDCPAAISFSTWPTERWQDFIRERGSVTNSLWLTRYPELAGLGQNANRNWIRGNRVNNCREFLLHDNGFAQCTGNQISTPATYFHVDFPERPGLFRKKR